MSTSCNRNRSVYKMIANRHICFLQSGRVHNHGLSINDICLEMIVGYFLIIPNCCWFKFITKILGNYSCCTDMMLKTDDQKSVCFCFYYILSKILINAWLFCTLFWRCTVSLVFLRFALPMVYYGLSFGIVSLSGNVYVNYAIMAVLELPAHLVSYICIKKFGRRNPQIILNAITALFLLAAIPIPKGKLLCSLYMCEN